MNIVCKVCKVGLPGGTEGGLKAVDIWLCSLQFAKGKSVRFVGVCGCARKRQHEQVINCIDLMQWFG